MKFRAKVEIGIVLLVVFVLLMVSVPAPTRVISDTGDDVETFIRNSNGNYWTATASNLQIAIWDLNGTGGTVWIPTGDLTIDQTIYTGNAAITIEGSAYRGSFYEGDSRLNLVAGIDGCGFNVTHKEVCFKNLYFYGTGWGTDNGENGINITDSEADYVKIIDCTFNFFGGHAIFAEKAAGLRIETCKGMNIDGNFIYCDCADSYIINCDATSDDHIYNVSAGTVKLECSNAYLSENDGYHLVGSSITIDDCRSNDNAGFGIYFQSGSGIISNCRIDDNGDDGIYLISNSATVVGNNIKESDESGLYIYSNVGHNTIVGNVFNNNGEDTSITDKYESGIYINNGNNNTIIGNRCKGAKYGIYEENTAGIRCTNLISNNNLEGNDVEAYTQDDGTSLSIVKDNKGYYNNTLYPFVAQASVPSVADNSTVYWLDTDGPWLYQVASCWGSTFYLNMSDTP